jgi:ribonuclease D
MMEIAMRDDAEQLVDTPEELAACCAHLATAAVMGFDTEFIGEESYHPKLCLIQVATEQRLFLIDPLALKNLEPFWRVLADPSHVVVVHAGREEVRLCHLWSGLTPGNLFDLQIAAGLVGLPYPMGHGGIVQELLGQRLDKGETLTDWRRRPLTSSQLRYASDDVRYLITAWRQLSGRLDELQRQEWAREEFERLRAGATPDESGMALPSEKWRKFKGAGALSRRGLAFLRELFLWREQQAAIFNRPPRTLVRDDLLVEIARKHPKTIQDLAVIRGVAKRHTDEIFQILQRVRALPAESCPPLAGRAEDPPQVGLVTPLLQAVLATVANRLQVAPNLAATTGDLKTLVRARLFDRSLDSGVLLTQGWRRQHILPELMAFLDGRTSLRLGQLQEESPLLLEPPTEAQACSPPKAAGSDA